MDTFTASNGITVLLSGEDYLTIASDETPQSFSICPENLDALREFFRGKEDERLGRWRWPENPDYVVYATDEETVAVLRETNCLSMSSTRGRVQAHSDPHATAAWAYFEAHPEPKPWLAARLGEVWLLTFSELTPLGGAYIVGDKHFMAADHGVALDDPRVIAGRRIWPEVSDA